MLRGQTVNIFLSTVPRWHSYLAFGTVLDCSYSTPHLRDVPSSTLKALC